MFGSTDLPCMETIRLPFRIENLLRGCAKIEGLLTASAEQLTLEYRMKDNIIGVWTGETNTRAIVWHDLEKAEGGLGFFNPWMALTARSLRTFEKLTSEPARLKLFIPWKDRRQLRTLVGEINLLLSFREADRYRERAVGDHRS